MTGSLGGHVSNTRTHAEFLDEAIQALRGTWDAERALTALFGAGYRPADVATGKKGARQVLRDLADAGAIVKVNERPVEYRRADS
ncbi:hypothetical protein [Streptomyces brevispora]|uniref:hypothetical protein n=1 Tax=Streptomyces brevispora TaxID=887462 RepID=UPI0035D94F40